MTDKESDPFDIKRGTKQGPPEQLTVQYGAAICIGRRPQKMAGGGSAAKNESAKYLGQKITFEQQAEEIKNRRRTAWAAFHKYRQEFTSRSYR